MLARLVVGGREPTSLDALMADVWPHRPPPSAVGTIHSYVSRLRRALGADVLHHVAAGYLIEADHVEVDSTGFEKDVYAGVQAVEAGLPKAALDHLGRALSTWPAGPAFGPLADLLFLAPEVHRLEDLRLQAVEMWVDANRALGRPAVALLTLSDLARAHPLRESLVYRLMRGLQAVGRQAEALVEYENCRRAIARDLGISPTPQLQELYAAILRGEGRGGPSDGAAPRPSRRPPPVVSLPARSRIFTGRERLLERATDLLDDAAPARSAGVLVLHGLGGVGKTELAVELAHRRRGSGHTAWFVRADDRETLSRGLADLARTLGVREAPGLSPVAALSEALALQERWILVVDGARSASDVEGRLPWAQNGEIIVTSLDPAWRRLGRPLPVRPFERAESVEFIRGRTGSTDVPGCEALAEQLGDLPGALEHVCAYIEQTRVPLGVYARLSARRPDQLVTRCGLTPDRPPIAAAWSGALDEIHRASPWSARMLEVLAHLSGDAIPLAIFHAHGAHALDIEDSLAPLLRFSLVEREADQVRVHRLVQAAVRARLTPPEKVGRLSESVHLLGELAAREPAEVHALTAHVVALTRHVAGDGTGVCGPAADESLLASLQEHGLVSSVVTPLLGLLSTCAERLAERGHGRSARQAREVADTFATLVGAAGPGARRPAERAKPSVSAQVAAS